MSREKTLFVGITSWNSAQLLPLCLSSLRDSTDAGRTRIVVFDNESLDDSRDIARRFGAEVSVGRKSQAEALSDLARTGDEPFVLLLHADVVMLNARWFDLLSPDLDQGGIGLVAPEDIGCGPHTRPWGKGMPESSFLLFRRDAVGALRFRQWRRRLGVPYFRTMLDFFGDHVTYNIPRRLAERGIGMRLLDVHASPSSEAAWYAPQVPSRHWRAEFGSLRYGLGNFYSRNGVVTHYHNWYDRVAKIGDIQPEQTTEKGGGGQPLEFVARATQRFIDDFYAGSIVLPPGIAAA